MQSGGLKKQHHKTGSHITQEGVTAAVPATRSERWQSSRDRGALLLLVDPPQLSGDIQLTAVKVQTIFALCGCRSQMHDSNTNIQRLNAVNSPSLTTTKHHIIMTKHLGLTGDQNANLISQV